VSQTANSTHYDSAGEARVTKRAPVRERASWAMFDFANTIFSMNVASLYFGVWLLNDLRVSSTMYAVAGATTSLLVVFTLPVFGAISDARRRRKKWVVGFTILACIACALIGVLGQTTLPLVGQEVLGAAPMAADWRASFGDVKWVLLAFIVANFAYQSALPFYNAMLPELVPANEQGRMSGIGVALGYVGSITGVLMVVSFFNGSMPLLGPVSESVLSVIRSIPFTEHAGRVSVFVPTALLFFAFAVPLMLFCRDRSPAPGNPPVDWRAAFRDVRATIQDARKHPGALRFILTTFLYQDAVGTIIGFMAVYAVRAVGFDDGSETTLFIVLTVPAVFGSYFFGWLADKVGPKRALSTTLVVWMGLLIAMIVLPGKAAFWAIGVALGLNFGGVNSVERPLLLSLVPDVSAGRYFSLMVLSARAAAIAGPLIWSLTVDSLEGPMGTLFAYRAALASVALMFAGAWWLLRGVPDKRPGSTVVTG
jgi:UMF1 family MFS transporter